MAGTTSSPWGAAWPLLSLLCTIGSFACVAVPLRALTRRVARARWVVPAASLPCFARWVVRFWLECIPVPWAWNHSGSLSRKTASTTCWSFAILASLIGAFSALVTPDCGLCFGVSQEPFQLVRYGVLDAADVYLRRVVFDATSRHTVRRNRAHAILQYLIIWNSARGLVVPLRALTRRVARACWVVPVASLPCFARWVVRFRLECFPVPWAWNHSGSLSRKTASTTCWSFAILAALIGAFSP